MQLTAWQRFRRWFQLTFLTYYEWPDGTLETDIDKRAGIDVFKDSEEVREAKVKAMSEREAKFQHGYWHFIAGIVVGYFACKYWH